MAPYQYEPLSWPHTQIRLLLLFPGSMCRTIECRLKTIDLVKARNTYEPISYCWQAYTRERWSKRAYKEKKQKTFRILVDGADFYITESLHGALWQMRLRKRIRVLWADAICINQADDEEKSAQVSIMAHIYYMGGRTLAWIGEADHRTSRAFKYLKRCARRSLDSSSSSSQCEQSDSELASCGPRCSHGSGLWRRLGAIWNSFSERRLNDSIQSIICRPYFRRTWVVQEVVNSECVLFMCGKLSIQWRDLANGITKTNLWVPHRHCLIALDDIWSSRDYDLIEVAMMTSSLLASDPRDKLYGILGLVLNSLMNVEVDVDYTKDAEEVFADFTKRLLLVSTNLRVLSRSYGSSPAKPGHVSSWVWNPQPEEPYDRFPLPDSFQCQAAQNSECQPTFSGKLLGLRGIVLQTVTAISSSCPQFSDSTFPFYTPRPRAVLQWLLWYFEHRAFGGLNEVPANSAAAEERRDRLWRTIWSGNLPPTTSTPDTEQLLQVKRIREIGQFDCEFMKRFGKYMPGENGTLTRWTEFKLLVAVEAWIFSFVFHNPAAIAFGESIPGFPSLDNRSLATTSGGDLALCPKETTVNDKLVLLQGSDVPFILRPIGEHWQIVGECYVHALMDGSAWDESRCEMLWIQ